MYDDEQWVGFDLDGTLAIYEGWKGELNIGEPIELMVERVKSFIDSGIRVKIFTARVGPRGKADEDVDKIRSVIQDWTEKHIGIRLEVTNEKDYAMIGLYDDRCFQVISNTGIIIGEEMMNAANKASKGE